MARAESQKRRQARLRSVAAHVRQCREAATSLRQCRRHAGGGGRQSDRRAVERPPGAAVRPGELARHQARRRKRRRQAQAHPRRDRQAARRRAGGVRSAERRLGVQHPRRRRGAYPAAARLRAGAARGPAGALCRRRPSSTTKCATRWRNSPMCARPTTSPATWPAQGQDRAARPGERGRCAVAPGGGQRRQAGARRRPDRADEGGEEPCRDRRRARRA